jgi:hypothetical protein
MGRLSGLGTSGLKETKSTASRFACLAMASLNLDAEKSNLESGG